MRSLSLGLPSLAITPVLLVGLIKNMALKKTRGATRSRRPLGSKLVFDVLHEPLRAGVFKLRLRDVSAPIFVDLREIDDERCGG